MSGLENKGEGKMTKSELIEKLSLQNGLLSKKESELVVNTLLDSIRNALVGGDRVEIRGFGSFTIRTRDAREARNPKSGEIVKISVKKTAFFKTGKELRERVNGND
jgi:integration host factor subunit beta